MRNRTYGGVRGRKTKVGRKLLRFPPTRLFVFLLCECQIKDTDHSLEGRIAIHDVVEDFTL